MKLGALTTLVRRDLRRTRGALATSGFGIAAGTAAMIFCGAVAIIGASDLDKFDNSTKPRLSSGFD